MLFARAQALADDRKLQLIEVDAHTEPPVYRLVDAAAARELRRSMRSRAASKSQSAPADANKSSDEGGAESARAARPKQVRFSLAIGEHDLSRRLERAREMLKEGHAVQLRVTLKNESAERSRAKSASAPVPEPGELRRLHAEMLARITRHLSDVLASPTSPSQQSRPPTTSTPTPSPSTPSAVSPAAQTQSPTRPLAPLSSTDAPTTSSSQSPPSAAAAVRARVSSSSSESSGLFTVTLTPLTPLAPHPAPPAIARLRSTSKAAKP